MSLGDFQWSTTPLSLQDVGPGSISACMSWHSLGLRLVFLAPSVQSGNVKSQWGRVRCWLKPRIWSFFSAVIYICVCVYIYIHTHMYICIYLCTTCINLQFLLYTISTNSHYRFIHINHIVYIHAIPYDTMPDQNISYSSYIRTLIVIDP